MIFAPRPLYPGHAAGVVKWGLTLIEDQQLAGLIMWIPAGTAYVIATCVIFLDWLRESENRVIAAARRSTPMMLTGFLATILLGGCDHEQKRDILNFSGDARRGEELVQQYGCGGCHLIPEVASADGNVGPPLMHVGTRVYIAGFLRNSPENMSVWLQDPQKILPGNAMPSMGISRKDSRDITAFLLSLK
jgi:cytochrome c2